MSGHVIGFVVPDISNKRNAFIIKYEAILNFEKEGTIFPRNASNYYTIERMCQVL
jgi:hypothetical protein